MAEPPLLFLDDEIATCRGLAAAQESTNIQV